jgi:hypothetical protein
MWPEFYPFGNNWYFPSALVRGTRNILQQSPSNCFVLK